MGYVFAVYPHKSGLPNALIISTLQPMLDIAGFHGRLSNSMTLWVEGLAAGLANPL